MMTQTMVTAALTLTILLPSAHADPSTYPVTLISQQYTRSVETPTTLKEATSGNLQIEMYSFWDWSTSALEVRLSPTSLPIHVSLGQVEVPADYPADLPLPQITLEDERLILSIPRINTLLHSVFEISARKVSLEKEPLTNWSSFFGGPIYPLIVEHTALDLSSALAHPPVVDSEGKAPLDLWIESLLQETLQPVGEKGMATIQIFEMNGFVTLPILLTVEISYSPDMAAQISEAIETWLINTGYVRSGKLSFTITIYRGDNHSPWISLSDLQLGLDRVR